VYRLLTRCRWDCLCVCLFVGIWHWCSCLPVCLSVCVCQWCAGTVRVHCVQSSSLSTTLQLSDHPRCGSSHQLSAVV